MDIIRLDNGLFEMYIEDIPQGLYRSKEQAEFWRDTILELWIDHKTELNGKSLADYLKDCERTQVLLALHRCKDNKTQAAKLLGIKRSTLVQRCKDLGLGKSREKYLALVSSKKG